MWQRIIVGVACGLIVLAVLACAAFAGKWLWGLFSGIELAGWIWQLVREEARFLIQIFGFLVPVALVVVWLCEFVRSRRWFDRWGPVRELQNVWARIGTVDEKPNDSTAAAIYRTGTTILIAVVILSGFIARS